jgi:hypothetical protein
MPALAALGVVCVLVACMLLSYAYEHTFHQAFDKLAQVFINATWNGPFGISIGFAFIGHAIQSLDNAIRDGLYAAISGTEWAWHQTVGQIASLFHQIAHTAEQVAVGTEQAFGWLRHHVIPEAIRLAVNPVGEIARLALKLAQEVRPVVNQIHPAITRTVYRDVPRAITKAEMAAIAALVHVPAAVNTTIEVTGSGIDYVGREAGALRHRVDELAKRVSPAALAGIVAASVLGIGWLKCSNVGRVGRRVCGLDSAILDGLLAGLLAVFGTIGLVTFAEEIQHVLHGFAGDVTGFWRADRPGPGGDRQIGQRSASG